MPSACILRPSSALVPILFIVPFSSVVRAQQANVVVQTNFTPGIAGSVATIHPVKPLPPMKKKQPREDRSTRRFFLLSFGVYVAAAIDMQESASLRPHFHEDDPFAKPFVKLAVPAYYAAGIAMASGVNWLGWKMARSQRWHSVWWLPQVCSITGNLIGYVHTKTHEHGY